MRPSKVRCGHGRVESAQSSERPRSDLPHIYTCSSDYTTKIILLTCALIWHFWIRSPQISVLWVSFVRPAGRTNDTQKKINTTEPCPTPDLRQVPAPRSDRYRHE